MTKPTDPKTHFEQVPLEIVKKIAEEEIPGRRNERSRRYRTVKPPAKKAQHSRVSGEPR